MEEFNRKDHWENIYETRELKDVSWFQPTPQTSLNFIANSGVSKNSKIIDIGGGDSFLVDHLLELGYTDITVLDISRAALQRAQKRLGEKANKVTWIESDITQFNSEEKYDVWHDRAAFHFLNTKEDVAKYLMIVRNHVKTDGNLVMGTFSTEGPTKCSGIEITQYSEKELSELFKNGFEKKEGLVIDHQTPKGTMQNFVFCRFTKT